MRYKHNSELVPLAKNLRKNMTKEERHLWHDFLKTFSVRFLRQKVFGPYILDFYCAEARLVIELDGSQHYENNGAEADRERSAFLAQYDLMVVRIPNHEVNQNFPGVCEHIRRLVEERKKGPPVQGGLAEQSEV